MEERRFRRMPGGRIELRLPAHERELLVELTAELSTMLDEQGDPALRRLFPAAHEDAELEREFRELTHGQLRTGREQALQLLADTAGRDELSAEEADAWLRALNDARLVLGTKLDVADDLDWASFDPEGPQAVELSVYAYLSWLQEQLVEAAA